MMSDKALDTYLASKSSSLKPVHLFHEAAERIPAYKDFLKKHKFSPSKVRTIADFSLVPPTTKENYILEYDFMYRAWDGDVHREYMISTSSGTTGNPIFWPRDMRTIVEGARYHELIFDKCFNFKKKKTLFINGFALGNWIAGTFTAESCFLVSLKGYPFTSVTPGYNAEEIIKVLREVSNQYEMTIIAGHAPFLKELIEEAVTAGIDFKNIDVRLLGTGQAITENWRSYLLGLLLKTDYQHSVVNLYGSADAALMAYESPESIEKRRFFAENVTEARNIFMDERLPSLYSYDPRLVYFEGVSNELHITKYGGVPLIRYNMHDVGGILENNIVYLFGREKFMAKIYGANVYTEHVQQALSHASLQSYLTGRFVLETRYDEKHNPILVCHTELNINVDVMNNSELLENVKRVFISEISLINSEYKDALSRMGEKAEPKIMLYAFGHEKYFPKDKVRKTV
jgi:phenylacetate-CoA ligase